MHRSFLLPVLTSGVKTLQNINLVWNGEYFLSKHLGSVFIKIKSRHLGLSNIKNIPCRWRCNRVLHGICHFTLLLENKETDCIETVGRCWWKQFVLWASEIYLMEMRSWSSGYEGHSSCRASSWSVVPLSCCKGQRGSCLVMVLSTCEFQPSRSHSLLGNTESFGCPQHMGFLTSPTPSCASPCLAISKPALPWVVKPLDRNRASGSRLTLYNFPFFLPHSQDRDCIRSWEAHKFWVIAVGSSWRGNWDWGGFEIYIYTTPTAI